MTNPSVDPAAMEVINFWFKELKPEQWYGGGPELDIQMTTRFKPLVEKALTTSELDGWTSTPQGSLALLILLDQMPRNIFRDNEPHRAWSGDAKGLQVATEAVARGHDQKIVNVFEAGRFPSTFYYLPFMHAEDLLPQVTSVSLCWQHLANCPEGTPEHDMAAAGYAMAQSHLDCVMKLGRFPKRNEPLGRDTTEEERKFLEEHPHGF